MKITVSKGSGFCPGVKRADNCIRMLIAKKEENERIYTLGKLIHNRLYNDELLSLGVEAIEPSELESLLKEREDKKTTVVIRTHGVTKDTSLLLCSLTEKYKRLSVVDMTCPSVKRIHKIAEENTDENTAFYLFCSKEHPEALGIISYANGEKHMISSAEELQALEFTDKIPVLCSQTTENLDNFKKIKEIFKKLFTNARIFDTICNVTENRQNEAIQIAQKSDMMIVVGGKDSSNTAKLAKLCEKVCPTVWIESPDELLTDFPDRVKNVGITAGASTPDGILTEVIKVMETKQIDFEALLEDTLKTIHTGDTVNGFVCAISDNELKLDLGVKVTGVLTKEQITDDPGANLRDMFKVGDEIAVFVIRVDDKTGLATVSKKRVDKDNSWIVIKEAYDNGEILDGKIVSVNKGGVVVSALGSNVFVPASQAGLAKGQDLASLVGNETRIKLIEFDSVKKRALGSIKVVLLAEKRAKEDAIWATLEAGQRYNGTVKNLASYGAFVDIGGIDGLLHNTELSWNKIKHPSQIVSVGQEISVYIKELDTENRKITLGYKTEDMDLFLTFAKSHEVGDILPAKIVSLTPFGAFAEVSEGVDGLIHISAISTERVNSPADVLKVGDTVDVKLLSIDSDKRRLSLSIRAIAEAAERAAKEEARRAELAEKRAADEAEAKRIAEEKADMAPYIVGSID